MARKIDILNKHSIENFTENGRLYAVETFTYNYGALVVSDSNIIDITDFSISELYSWLGY